MLTDTHCSISELAEEISKRTGFSVQYDALRHRISRAEQGQRLPAIIIDVRGPGRSRPVRKILTQDIDTWCHWFAASV